MRGARPRVYRNEHSSAEIVRRLHWAEAEREARNVLLLPCEIKYESPLRDRRLRVYHDSTAL